MSNHTPRLSQPRRWASLALTTAVGLATASPGLALQNVPLPQAASQIGLPMQLVDSQGGEAGESGSLEAQGGTAKGVAEGGEGGEGGVSASGDPTVDFLAGLLQIQGHLTTGFALQSQGHGAHGIEHMKHPMEEVYESLEHELEELGLPQFEDLLQGLESAAAENAAPETLAGLKDQIQAWIDEAWQKAAGAEPRDGLDAIRFLVLKAGEEWSEGVAQGAVAELHEYQDAWGFIEAARARAGMMAAGEDAKLTAAAETVLAALDDLTEAFPGVLPQGAIGGDAELFLATAARIELAASQVR